MPELTAMGFLDLLPGVAPQEYMKEHIRVFQVVSYNDHAQLGPADNKF